MEKIEKKCTSCCIVKELSEFSIKKNGLYGKNSQCKLCVKIKANKRKEKTKVLLDLGELPIEKTCTKCQLVKSITEFSIDTTKNSGYYSSCKDCNSEYVEKYRNENIEKVALSKKKSIKKKKEYYSNYKKIWSEINHEIITKRRKRYYSENKERINTKNSTNRKKRKIKKKESYLLNNKRICENCKKELSLDQFSKSKTGKNGFYKYCKNCVPIFKKIESENNKKRSREYYRLNKSTLLKQIYLRKVYRLKNDSLFKLQETLRHRTRRAIYDSRGEKVLKTNDLLGCTVIEARDHIEKQFTHGMTWGNHGIKGWHIDHIIPCASFNLKDTEEQKKCFNYKNLQPLWAEDNLKKGSKTPANNT